VKEEGAKVLGFFVATIAVIVVFALFGTKLLGAVSGAENELITALKKQEVPGSAFDESGTLKGERVSYQRLSVAVSPDGQSATVSGTLDFVGEREGIRVSSLGFERVRFVRKDGEWRPLGGTAPRLSAIVRALDRRRRSLQAADIPTATRLDVAEAERYRRLEGRTFRVEAWYIRSEKEGVEVSEDYHLTGRLPERPVDERATRRLSLSEDVRGEFLFPDGLL
jgi:hypothetical protein